MQRPRRRGEGGVRFPSVALLSKGHAQALRKVPIHDSRRRACPGRKVGCRGPLHPSRQPLRCTASSAKPALGARVPPSSTAPASPLFECREGRRPFGPRSSPPLRHRARQRLRVPRSPRPAGPRSLTRLKPACAHHPGPPDGRSHRFDPAMTPGEAFSLRPSKYSARTEPITLGDA